MLKQQMNKIEIEQKELANETFSDKWTTKTFPQNKMQNFLLNHSKHSTRKLRFTLASEKCVNHELFCFDKCWCSKQCFIQKKVNTEQKQIVSTCKSKSNK